MDLGALVNTAWDAYRTVQEHHPVLGSMLTATVTFPFADITSQLITDKNVDWKKVRYTLGLSPLYGLGIHALMQSGELVEKYISAKPLAKAALGPNLWSNAHVTFFYVNNTVGERTEYKLHKWAQHYMKLCGNLFSVKNSRQERWAAFRDAYLKNIPLREYLYSVASTLTFWNAFQYMNYTAISKEMQTPASLAVGALWGIVISCWSLVGRRKIVAAGIRKQ